MDSLRIAELLDPFFTTPGLSRAQLDQISIYIDLLLRWNARVNLTAIRTPEEIVTRHFGESLFAARHLLPGADDEKAGGGTGADGRLPAQDGSPQAADESAGQRPAPAETNSAHSARVVDLGSGAGFPGIPWKIWSPQTPVTLIESNQKKVAFLREVIRALTLTDINVFPARAEDYPAAAALVALRAVERFQAILPLAARLLAPAGTLALLIGQSQVARARNRLPALRWFDPIPIPESETRVLVRANTDPVLTRDS